MGEFKFKEGSVIKQPSWAEGKWFKLAHADGENLFGYNESGIPHHYQSSGKWVLHKPTFKWNTTGMWGKSKKTDRVFWFAKTSKWTWVRLQLNPDGMIEINQPNANETMQTIFNSYEPCDPPDWELLRDINPHSKEDDES